VRFLVDECLTVRLVELLGQAGHDVVHVTGRGLAGQPDEAVLACAQSEERVLVSADTDFGEILARSRSETPSVVLFRRADRSGPALAAVLLNNLDLIVDDLEKGAFVVITDDRLRIRALPMR
jgi:predicted nuclease of predicted toxin-antitoxin system